MTNTIIAVKDLEIGYKRKSLLTDKLSFIVEPKQIWGIVGPNGSGKTTLIKTILGLLKPLNGTISKNTNRIGYVPQRSQADPVFPVSALDVVLMGLSAVKGPFKSLKSSDKEIARNLLNSVGLSESIDKTFRTLSGGQRQRALIARALAVNPDLLILDEPTDGMDISGEADFFALIENLVKEKNLAVIVITHALHLAASHTQNMVLFYGENKAETGKTIELLEPKNLEKIYKQKVAVKNIDGVTIIYLPAKEQA